MAFLSPVSTSRLEQKHLAALSPERRLRIYSDANQAGPKLVTAAEGGDMAEEEVPVGRLGLIPEFEFNGKVRVMAPADPRAPLARLRVWTAEQDGAIHVRYAATGHRAGTIERKSGEFVTSMCYHRISASRTFDGLPQDNMYVGYSDGFLRVYRIRTQRKLTLPQCRGPSAGLKFGDPASPCKVTAVRDDSPAFTAGFLAGMTVLSVGGTAVSTPEQVAASISAQVGPCAVLVDVRTSAGQGSLEPEYEMVANVKKHIKEITCMVVIDDGTLFTGGRDWQIYLWAWEARRCPQDGPLPGCHWTKEEFVKHGLDWEAALPGNEAFRPYDQFSGAQNAVTALFYRPARCVFCHLVGEACVCPGRADGSGLLYSGGDDFVIRCIDLSNGNERTVPADEATGARGFPIVATGRGRGGHQAGIRALAANDKYLFSASRDGTVRVWDADKGYPISLGGHPDNALVGRVPPQGHPRAENHQQLCLVALTHDAAKESGHLVSAGADGVIRVWDGFGSPFGLCELRPPDERVGSVAGYLDQGLSTPALEFDPLVAGDLVSVAEYGRRWARLSDGRYVYASWLQKHDPEDVDGCHQAWLEDQRFEHVGSVIQGLNVVQPNVHGRVTWTLVPDELGDGDTVRVHYSETDAGAPGDTAHHRGFTDPERKLAVAVSALREEILVNAAELDALRRQQAHLRDRDSQRKSRISSQFRDTYEQQVKEFYWLKLMKWLAAARSRERRIGLAGLMLRTTARGLRCVYYAKLRDSARERRKHRRQNKLTNALLASSDRGLTVLYWQHLNEYAKRFYAAKKRRQIGESLMRSTEYGVTALYFSKWARWRTARNHAAKRRMITRALMGKSDAGLKQIYWHRLLRHTKRAKHAGHRRVLAATLAQFSDSNLSKNCFARWLRWLRAHKAKRKRREFAEVLSRGSDHLLVALYNKKCIDYMSALRKAELQQRMKELDAQFQRLADLEADTLNLSEEEIEEAIRQCLLDIDVLEAEIKQLQGLIAAQSEANAALERDIAMMTAEKPEGDADQRLAWLMRRLKSHGCNCRFDTAEIAAAKKEWSQEWNFRAAQRASADALAHPRAPARHVENALQTIRSAVQESWDNLAGQRHWKRHSRPEPGKLWPLNVVVFTSMATDPKSRQLFKRCHSGVARLVIAWDRMTSREKQVIYGQKHDKRDLKPADPGADVEGTVEHTERTLLRSVRPEVKAEIDENFMWILMVCSLMHDYRFETVLPRLDSQQLQRVDSQQLGESRLHDPGSPGSGRGSPLRAAGSPRGLQGSGHHSRPAGPLRARRVRQRELADAAQGERMEASTSQRPTPTAGRGSGTQRPPTPAGSRGIRSPPHGAAQSSGHSRPSPRSGHRSAGSRGTADALVKTPSNAE